jgi:hypothetical protein
MLLFLLLARASMAASREETNWQNETMAAEDWYYLETGLGGAGMVLTQMAGGAHRFNLLVFSLYFYPHLVRHFYMQAKRGSDDQLWQLKV